ncbi:SPOR domain-containing protein [Vogesella sp. LIG4]|uniref:SPOR domain-containing protein n=1 Tax=Vogesella sp. LIG4 TaxID=1192162 RepID=UPI000820201D|nr:SPOR domain-containing protein [Vogesella sp. LIG4]SCK12097.1 Sporulation related domain-containing protein [Vogesella sp. LIG4]
MKWLIGSLVVLNIFAGLYAVIKQKPALDLSAREVNAGQLKLLPADWKLPQAASAPQPAAMHASAPLATIASALTPALPAPQAPQAKAASQPVAAAVAKPQEKAAAKPEASKAAEPKDSKPLPAKVEAKAAAPVASAKLCRSWGPLNPQQLERVQGGLPALKLAAQPSASVTDGLRGSGRIWVHYPPLATQAETQTLVSELRSKGFDSYIVKTDGEFHNHLSLGLFGKQAAADDLLRRLKAAGYDKGVADVRGEKVQLTTLSFKALDDATATHLKALQQRLLSGIPLQECH